MSVKVLISGDKELTSSFNRLYLAISRNEMVKIQRKAAKPLQKIAKSLTPSLTGNLKKTIKIFTGKSKDIAIVMVGFAAGKGKNPDGYYGFWVDTGTGGRKEGGTHKAAKALETASQSNEVSEDIIFSEINNLIDRIW